MKKRITSLFMVLLIAVSVFSLPVFAENPPVIKNIIYLIPDGGGYALYDFANMVKEAGGISEDKFPYKTYTDSEPMTMRDYLAGSATTSPITGGITDSAAAGTALATGYKTVNGYMGIDKTGSPKANLVEAAKSKGKATGLVATYEWMHATPGAFSAHAMNRSDYADIYRQIETKGIEVVLSAGYGAVADYATIQNAVDAGYIIVEGWADTDAVQPGDTLWGNVAHSSLPYDIKNNAKQANLAELTQAAITALSADPDGFFLMVEGSKVDSGGHANDALISTSEYLAFDAAFRVAIDFAKGRNDTIVICTPDHDTGALSIPADPTSFVAEVVDGITPTGLTWGTTGHSSQNVGVWMYVPEGVKAIEGLSPVLGDTKETRENYVIDNTDIAPWCASLMGVDLDKLTEELFLDVTKIGQYNPATGTFTFNNGNKYVHKNECWYYENGEKIDVPGKNALYLNGKFFVPSEMVAEEDWNYLSETQEGITGTGTKSDPYIIDDEADFMEFNAELMAGNTYEGKYICQKVNLDLSEISEYKGLNEKYTFAGTYDGCGNKIKVNLSVSGNSTIFPYVTGKIMNLGTEGSLNSTGSYASGMVRSLRAGSIMVNCWSTMDIKGNSTCGLVYSNYGTIENCFFGGTLEGTTVYALGAPHGDAHKTVNGYYVERIACKNVSGTTAVSDIVAQSTLAETLNNGRAAAAATIGVSEEDISYWTNEEGYPVHYIPLPVVESVAIAPINPTLNKGDGIELSANVTGKYKFSKEVTWSIEGEVSEGTKIESDGFLVIDSNETAKSFKVMAKSNQDGGIVDVITVTVGGKATAEPDGSRARPYLIATAEDFKKFTDDLASGKNFKDKYFRQTADIDMSGVVGYAGLGSKATFAGTYDGNGYIINVAIVSEADGCIFPYTTGTIMNLGVTGSIKNATFAGAICRSVRAGGKLINCWSDASLDASDIGVVAWSNYGLLANCYFSGTAKATGSLYNVTNKQGGSTTYKNYYIGTSYMENKESSEITTSQYDKYLATWLNGGISDTANLSGIPASSLKTWTIKDGKVTFGAQEENNDIVLTIDKKEASVFGEMKENDVAPLIVNGRTMLPARFVTEALGGEVSWDGDKREVGISKEGVKLVLTIDKDIALLNGEEVKLDAPATIIEGRTYPSVRFIAEALGATVSWNGETKEVTITR